MRAAYFRHPAPDQSELRMMGVPQNPGSLSGGPHKKDYGDFSILGSILAVPCFEELTRSQRRCPSFLGTTHAPLKRRLQGRLWVE